MYVSAYMVHTVHTQTRAQYTNTHRGNLIPALRHYVIIITQPRVFVTIINLLYDVYYMHNLKLYTRIVYNRRP